ncbi:mitochondrial inner membrane protease subunit 2 [Strongylocentrotus purpuratus]|uniref:Mitochondrial inner membrane protease subunit 2 n=1 Tax=Strongylocentrotus purpuratus TaxID=7668 RepID=A0A7M7HD45_STRPU|nr:mitochondrial inner membrane protease subunit 2 [Strongylocentrotus purpuratus]
MSAGRQAFRVFAGGFTLGVGGSLAFFDNIGYFATVSGKSMQPVLNPDNAKQRDVLFLSRWAVRDYNIERGDVVSLISPHHPREVLIKRVIALEGDTIRTLGYKNRYVTVPEGHCWLEGDHRVVSLDSNYFGPIALGLLHAKASHIVWPFSRCQKVESLQPADRPILMGESLAAALVEMFVANENSLSVELQDEFGIIGDKT